MNLSAGEGGGVMRSLRTWLARVAAVAALAGAWAGAALAEPSDGAARLDRAFEAIERQMARSPSPGLVVAVSDRARTLKVMARGYADLKAGKPMTPQALFPIGSLSKSFTAAALMADYDEGRFDPNRPFQAYLPWFSLQSKTEAVTGARLMSHTAGLPYYRPDLASAPYAAYAMREVEPAYEPGARFWYSNIGYQVLGYALERIDGQPYPDIVARRLFRPLGMAASAAAVDDALRARLPVSYASAAGGGYVEQPWFEYTSADGSIVSTADDLEAYARMVLNKGAGPAGRILSPRAFALMTTPVLDGYAFGWMVRQEAGGTVVSHPGGIAGFSSLLEAHMDDGFALVILRNGGEDPAFDRWAAAAVRAALRGEPQPDPPAPPAPMDVAPFAGRYVAETGEAATFAAADGALLLKQGGRETRLTPAGPDRFVPTGAVGAVAPYVFTRGDGGVTEVRHGGEWFASDRYSGPRAFQTPKAYAAYVGRYVNHNPELTGVRIFTRKGRLMLSMESWVRNGTEDGMELVEAAPGTFRLAQPDYSPERYRFDTVVDGRALRMTLSGMPLYRVEDGVTSGR